MNNSGDTYWMGQALKEAGKGIGLTAPNPPVGAVLVEGNTLLASGWHHRAGELHAEREVFKMAREKGITPEQMQRSTLYVTLEPCSTYGKTPPCTDAIRESGIKRVVYGATDPNRRHSGAADALLKESGISVLSGVLKEDCERILRPFAMVQTQDRPWIVAKTAFSLDGKVSRPRGEGQWISSNESRLQVHQLRARADAILTGGATVRQDNPCLTIRGVETAPWKKQPVRAVVTRNASSLPADSHLFTDSFKNRTRVYENIPLREVMEKLAVEEDVQTVLVESGPVLTEALLAEGLIDEWIAYVAPLICGGPYPAAGTEIFSRGFPWMPVPLDEAEISKVGVDLMIRGIVRR